MARSFSRRDSLLLVCIALPIYLAAFLFVRPDRDPETWEYGDIASHIVAGHGFAHSGRSGDPVATASQMPAYPLVLAGFRAFVPMPYVSLALLQVLLWLTASALLARLSHRFVGAPERASALVVALWPPLALYTLSYHPLVWRASALIFVLAAAAACRRRPELRWAGVLGGALGYAALVRATFWILPLVFVPWAVRRNAGKALVALWVFGVSVSPWVVRNRIALDAWIPGTTTGGLMALAGNQPGASGSLDEPSLQRAVTTLPVDRWSEPEPLRDAFYRARVVRFWQEHPTEALSLYAKKLLYLWTFRPGIGERYPPRLTVSYVVLWSMTLPLIAIGAFIAWRRPGAEAPLVFIGTWLVLSLLYAVFAVNMRYRFEAEPLLVPYAVLAAGSAVARLRRRVESDKPRE